MSYEEACDLIVTHAKKASRYFNDGRLEIANREKENARRAFRTATEIDESHPQAYLNMANFLLNTQELEESVHYWDMASNMVGNKDRNLREYVESRRKRARFGLYSSRRDGAYQDIKNLSQALFWSKKQLEVIPNHPEVHFDRGTMQIMLNRSSDVVISSLKKSQDVSLAGWISDRRARGYACNDAGSQIIYDWSSYTAKYIRVLDSSHKSYVVLLRNIELVGQDGIITHSTRGRKTSSCELFLPSAGIYHNLPRNIPMRMIWLDDDDGDKNRILDHERPVHDYTKGKSRNFYSGSAAAKTPILERAASVVQYASMAYYHWVAEGLGRLLLLLPHLKTKPDMFLILPNSPAHEAKNHFIVQYVRMVAPFLFTPSNRTRIIWYNAESLSPIDTRMRVKKLYYANWNPTTTLSHCLVPGEVLRLIRSSLVFEDEKRKRSLVVFCLRTNVSMRVFQDSTGLLNQIRDLTESSSLSFVLFEGNKSVKKQIDLFSRAAIVVGVHGGAFGNIVFCAPQTLVIEIGFQTPQTDHYAHISNELNLEYHRVEAMTDGDFSVSSEFVYIDQESSNSIAWRVEKRLKAEFIKNGDDDNEL